jgi:hypothetical protein
MIYIVFSYSNDGSPLFECDSREEAQEFLNIQENPGSCWIRSFRRFS